MNRPIFETFWEVDGRQIFDLREVERLVIDEGKLAREITASEQLRRWETQRLAEKWHQRAVERYNKLVAEQAFKNSPEGRAAAARREAASSGGAIVTIASQDATPFDELDRFSPQHTDVFKQ